MEIKDVKEILEKRIQIYEDQRRFFLSAMTNACKALLGAKSGKDEDGSRAELDNSYKMMKHYETSRTQAIILLEDIVFQEKVSKGK